MSSETKPESGEPVEFKANQENALKKLLKDRADSIRKVYNELAGGSDILYSDDFLDFLEDKMGLDMKSGRLELAMQRLDPHGEKQITFERFHAELLIEDSIVTRFISGSTAVPDFVGFCRELLLLFYSCVGNSSGEVCSYIPALASKNPDLFACAVCTVDGQQFSVGDDDAVFPLEGMSTAFTYCSLLQDLSKGKIHEFIGRQSSDAPFSAIALNKQGKPHNPLNSAGGIVACSLFKPKLHASDRFEEMMKLITRLGGGKVCSCLCESFALFFLAVFFLFCFVKFRERRCCSPCLVSFVL